MIPGATLATMNNEPAHRTPGTPPALPQALAPSAAVTSIFAVGAGVSTAAMHLGASVVAFSVLAVMLIAVYLTEPKALADGEGYDVKTLAPTDFNGKAFLLPAAVTLLGPAVGQLVPVGALDLPLWVPAAGLGVASGAAAALALRTGYRRKSRAGRRRLKAIVAAGDIADVTDSRLRAAEAHLDVLGTLVRLGAVDGIRVRTWLLGRALGIAEEDSAEALAPALRALRGEGLVATSDIDAGDRRAEVFVELTRTGAHTLHALHEGR